MIDARIDAAVGNLVIEGQSFTHDSALMLRDAVTAYGAELSSRDIKTLTRRILKRARVQGAVFDDEREEAHVTCLLTVCAMKARP